MDGWGKRDGRIFDLVTLGYVDVSDVRAWMCLTGRIRAWSGQVMHAAVSWWMLWLWRPFFWFDILSVDDVHCAWRTWMGSLRESNVLLCQKTTLWILNCWVRRRSDGRW